MQQRLATTSLGRDRGINWHAATAPGVQANFRFDGPQLLSSALRIEHHLDGKIDGVEDDAGKTDRGVEEIHWRSLK
ncbi:hypothetical protein BG74_05450 [Sodalis-like endosymbiont of Proechinophthirus fluctus]|nr:hypothetical protein BG74_05450 [Sodalis-like endosymbiont of Proechinophthirus fluctus]